MVITSFFVSLAAHFRDKAKELFSIDLRALALVRMGLAGIVIFDLVNRMRDLQAHYTDFGVLPRIDAIIYAGPWGVSLHTLGGTWQVEAALFVIALVFAAMLFLGFKTRLSTIITWLLLLSLHNRNLLNIQGGDALLRMCLFWGMFLPWGVKYSWDQALASRNNAPPKEAFSFGTAGFLIQIGIIYFFTALFKTGVEWIHEGTAIYYALHMDQFATHFGHFLLGFPHLITALSFGVWWLELILPFILFFPIFTRYTKTIGAFSIVSLHFGLFLSMDLGPFPWVSMVSALAFLPSVFWDFISSCIPWHRAHQIKIFYDGSCGFCMKAVRVIQTFLLLPYENAAPASSNSTALKKMLAENSWVIMSKNRRYHVAFAGATQIVSASPLFWFFAPLMRLPGINALGEWCYRIVASHRTMQCQLEAEIPPQKVALTPFSNIIAFFCIILVIMTNASGLPTSTWTLPSPLSEISILFGIQQKWNMFSPAPPKSDGWYVIPGKLQNGVTVDIFREGAPVVWSQQRPIFANNRGERWRKYLMNLESGGWEKYRGLYAQYLCRQWNDTHTGGEKLQELEIFFIRKFTTTANEPPILKRESFWKEVCPL